jgi:hypothetical protein
MCSPGADVAGGLASAAIPRLALLALLAMTAAARLTLVDPFMEEPVPAAAAARGVRAFRGTLSQVSSRRSAAPTQLVPLLPPPASGRIPVSHPPAAYCPPVDRPHACVGRCLRPAPTVGTTINPIRASNGAAVQYVPDGDEDAVLMLGFGLQWSSGGEWARLVQRMSQHVAPCCSASYAVAACCTVGQARATYPARERRRDRDGRGG